MSGKRYCPILLIGYDPPKDGGVDMRTCKKDCAWYNSITGQCHIVDISETLDAVKEHVELLTERDSEYYEDDWE